MKAVDGQAIVQCEQLWDEKRGIHRISTIYIPIGARFRNHPQYMESAVFWGEEWLVDLGS